MSTSPHFRTGSGRASLRSCLLFAVGYALTASLCVALQRQGSAQLIWAPAGIGLVGVLQFGRRGAIAIWFGALFAGGSRELLLDGSLDLPRIPLALLVATAALIQAGLGAYLLRRLAALPAPLDERNVTWFLVIAGPIGGVVHALLQYGIALLSHSTDASSFALMSGLGDTLGGILVAPIAMIILAEPRAYWRSMWKTVALPLGLAFALLAVAFINVHEREKAMLENRLATSVDAHLGAFQAGLEIHIEGLRGIATLFETMPGVARQEFDAFVADKLRRYPEIQALEWIPNVPSADRASHEAQARLDGHPEFSITERSTEGNLITAKLRDEYYPVYYVAPYEGNEKAFGFDLASNPTRRAALLRAETTGRPIATGRITLVQERGPEYGVLIFVPCYRAPSSSHLTEAPEILGFALGVYRVEDMVAPFIQQLSLAGVYLRIDDSTAPEGSRLLLDTVAPETSRSSMRPMTRTLDIAGRNWLLTFSPNGDHAVAHSSGMELLLGGSTLLAALLAGILLITNGRRATIEQLVVSRTLELTDTNKLLSEEIKDRKRIEKERNQIHVELQQAKKLESLGRLAAGVAHEINTPTQYIGDNVNFLGDGIKALLTIVRPLTKLTKQRDPFGDQEREEMRTSLRNFDVDFLAEELPRALQEAMEGIDRISSIVHSMKDFSYQGGEGMAPIDLNRAIQSTVTVSRSELKFIANVHFDLQPDLPPVPCFRNEINQVLLNLIINAAHAIEPTLTEQHKIGTVHITTRCDDEWIVIRIQDDGEGIPPDIIDRIFDPFFTTKEIGKGTGQGLAIVHSVVTQRHKGRVQVTNVPEGGAMFEVHLPLHAIAA